MKQRSPLRYVSLFLAPLIIGIGIGWLIGLSASPILSSVLAVVLGVVGSVVAALGDTAHTANGGDTETDSKRAFNRSTNPWPVAMLVVGVVVGSGFGMTARNRAWFGSDLSSEIHRWTTASQSKNHEGLSTADLIYVLLESQYPGAKADILQRNVRDGNGSRIQREIDFWVDLGLDKKAVVDSLFQSVYGSNQLGSGLEASSAPRLSERFDSVLFSGTVAQEECDNYRGATEDTLRMALRSSTVPSLQKLPELIPDDEVLSQIVETVICAQPE